MLRTIGSLDETEELSFETDLYDSFSSSTNPCFFLFIYGNFIWRASPNCNSMFFTYWGEKPWDAPNDLLALCFEDSEARSYVSTLKRPQWSLSLTFSWGLGCLLLGFDVVLNKLLVNGNCLFKIYDDITFWVGFFLPSKLWMNESSSSWSLIFSPLFVFHTYSNLLDNFLSVMELSTFTGRLTLIDRSPGSVLIKLIWPPRDSVKILEQLRPTPMLLCLTNYIDWYWWSSPKTLNISLSLLWEIPGPWS